MNKVALIFAILGCSVEAVSWNTTAETSMAETSTNLTLASSTLEWTLTTSGTASSDITRTVDNGTETSLVPTTVTKSSTPIFSETSITAAFNSTSMTEAASTIGGPSSYASVNVSSDSTDLLSSELSTFSTIVESTNNSSSTTDIESTASTGSPSIIAPISNSTTSTPTGSETMSVSSTPISITFDTNSESLSAPSTVSSTLSNSNTTVANIAAAIAALNSALAALINALNEYLSAAGLVRRATDPTAVITALGDLATTSTDLLSSLATAGPTEIAGSVSALTSTIALFSTSFKLLNRAYAGLSADVATDAIAVADIKSISDSLAAVVALLASIPCSLISGLGSSLNEASLQLNAVIATYSVPIASSVSAYSEICPLTSSDDLTTTSTTTVVTTITIVIEESDTTYTEVITSTLGGANTVEPVVTATATASVTSPIPATNAGQAAVSSDPALPTTVTTVVTAFTTYCPEPTALTFNGQVYVITKATTLTITDCPCTLVSVPTPSVQPPLCNGLNCFADTTYLTTVVMTTCTLDKCQAITKTIQAAQGTTITLGATSGTTMAVASTTGSAKSTINVANSAANNRFDLLAPVLAVLALFV